MAMGKILGWLLLGLAGLNPQEPAPFQIAVNVNLVVLHVIVRDQNGKVPTDLRREDFEVYEDGVRQTIRNFQHEDLPVTVGLVIDHSGSMRSKLTEVTAAARSFVQSSSPADQMFVVNFNEKVTLGLPKNLPFTNRPELLANAISGTRAEGQTALYDAIAEGLDRVNAGESPKKVLIVISDGGDNVSSHRLQDVSRLAEKSNALIYTIGVFDPDDEDRNPGVLRRLAQLSGGEAFFPGELRDVVAVCENIARDIRNQYAIGYSSASTKVKPGAHRSIRVTARTKEHGKLTVRTRAGYLAP